jgi:hypothetical protein
MVSSEDDTLRGDNAATSSIIARPRSGSILDPTSHQASYISSGITSYETDATLMSRAGWTTTNESHAAVAMALIEPPCLRQEATPMTLVGLLLRGMDGDDGGLPRPTDLPAPAGTGWAYLAPEFPPLDAAGPGRLRATRRMQDVLGEAIQIIASDIPTEGGASCSGGLYASQ